MFDLLNSDAALSRRAWLGNYAGSMGALALAQLLTRSSGALGDDRKKHPAETGLGRAKAVICLFQHGGPSQMDLFDPKPALNKYSGQPYPAGEVEAHFDKQKGNVLGSPYKFIKQGQCGMELCELMPRLGAIADDLTLVRSMNTESVDHEAALRLIHNGKLFAGLPVWGSWVTYALGTENENLPAYVVLSDPKGLPVDGEKNWSSGFLPAINQGTMFRSGASPVHNLEMPSGVTPTARKNQLAFLEKLNRRHMAAYPESTELAARIRNFEIAARMQSSVPEVADLSGETAETRELYGLDNPASAEYGARCLLARRLVEKGVRFVQLVHNGQPWDTHSKNADSLKSLCAMSDQPSAALVTDLKRRGLLDSTIVIWTGEFGRLPVSQGTDGRDHNRHAFSMWIAGGGFKPGYVHGGTDDFAYKSVDKVVTVHDLHATLLDRLGLDHRKLTFPFEGRDASLSDASVTGAEIVSELLA
ncbi:MAG: DUF1501 domain-containing protein [Planctomycetota bacterium]|nr:DUF1501 domain-containing protein [Planctomycetota bacterium]